MAADSPDSFSLFLLILHHGLLLLHLPFNVGFSQDFTVGRFLPLYTLLGWWHPPSEFSLPSPLCLWQLLTFLHSTFPPLGFFISVDITPLSKLEILKLLWLMLFLSTGLTLDTNQSARFPITWVFPPVLPCYLYLSSVPYPLLTEALSEPPSNKSHCRHTTTSDLSEAGTWLLCLEAPSPAIV